MKILFLAQRVPYPPNKGDKLRAFNEIKFLSKRHAISLCCLSDGTHDLQYRKALQSYCQSIDIVPRSFLKSKIRVFLSLLRPSIPLTRSYFYSAALQARINHRIYTSTYDLIFVYCSSMAQYVEHVQDIPKVIDFVDVDSEKWAQYASHSHFPKNLVYSLESRRLRRYEASLSQIFLHGFLISQKECVDFQHFVTENLPLTPITNGVDYEMFHPSGEAYHPDTLAFTGAMDYFANVEAMLYFSEKILPLIKQTISEVRLYIIGSNPAPEIVRLGAKFPNIFVTGFVEQVQPYVHKAAAFVAPMRIARGVQNKILEAMAMGVPVVTSSLGFEGILATQGYGIFVEDEPQAFADVVIQLLRHPEVRRQHGEYARQMIIESYNWHSNIQQLERILKHLVER